MAKQTQEQQQTVLALLASKKLEQPTEDVGFIITGSRNFNDAKRFAAALDGRKPTILMVGDCKGADQLAREYAKKHGIRLKVFNADWAKHKKAAGPIRNQQMVDWAMHNCRLVLAFAFVAPDSVGTVDCARRIHAAKLALEIVKV